MSGPGEITRLLAEWSGGNQAALDRLVPIVYDELRSLASRYMRSERSEPLLQTTALVHEAYLRLLERKHVSCDTRSQFFAVAAQAMRRILVDYARGRNRAKRAALAGFWDRETPGARSRETNNDRSACAYS
jgi:RNA polymerase sigma factor (TIGR02999 family)